NETTTLLNQCTSSEPRASSFIGQRISEPKLVTGLVIFALNRIIRAAVVEPEHFVGQVQACKNKLQVLVHAEAGLGVNLSMLIQIGVSERTGFAERHLSRGHNGLTVRVC